MVYTIGMPKKELATSIAENKAYYNSIGRVWCTILNSYVHFTSEGRLHLIYKGNRKKRPVAEQAYKLRLFPLVIPALKNSNTIEAWRFPEISEEGKDVQFYAITCVVSRKSPIEVRVIVKRTGDGQFNYHSVMEHKTKISAKKPRTRRG